MMRKRFLPKSPPQYSGSNRLDGFSANANGNNVHDIRQADDIIASDFDVSMMPTTEIYRRTLHPYSIHASSTGGWTATLSRPDIGVHSHHVVQSVKYLHYTFSTEREARKFCKAYSPPKYHKLDPEGNGYCMICATDKVVCQTSVNYCRNCGSYMCDLCTRRWGIRMIPRTYHYSSGQCNTKHTVRVCKSCDWLSNAFCLSLLQGRYNDTLTLFETGNVNLRTSFADIHKEAMFPIHCAVLGGNVDLVRWLVDVQLCPISVIQGSDGKMKSLQTSECRTLLDLAMTGRRPKVDVLMFLIQKGLSMDDVKDTSLASKTLQAILSTGKISPTNLIQLPSSTNPSSCLLLLLNEETGNDNSSCLNRTTSVVYDDINHVGSYPIDESVTVVEDMCTLCCEKPMDCALVPCGHQLCCSTCGSNLGKCPICKVSCTVLRIYRQ